MVITGKDIKTAVNRICKTAVIDPYTNDGYIDICTTLDTMFFIRMSSAVNIVCKISVTDSKILGAQLNISDLLSLSKNMDVHDITVTINKTATRSRLIFTQKATKIAIPFKEKIVKRPEWKEKGIRINIEKIKSLSTFIPKPLVKGILLKSGDQNSISCIDESKIGIIKWEAKEEEELIVLPFNGWSIFDRDISVYATNKYVVISNEEVIVTQPAIAITIPDITDNIEREKADTITCSKSELRKGLNSCTSFSQIDNPFVTMCTENNILTIKAVNKIKDTGFIQEMTIENPSDMISMKVNLPNIISAISSIQGKEKVIIGKLKKKPIMFVESEGSRFYTVIQS